MKLFADDCILYSEIHSPNDQALLNSSLGKIQTWCETWQMRINLKKTVSMTITRKRQPLNFSYSINGHSLPSVQSYKYLGVQLTSDLKWNEHVSFLQQRATQKLMYLKRSLSKATPEIKLLAYKTFILPILEYASVVWDPYTQININKLESVLRKAIRFVYNSYSWHTSPTALLKSAQLECLQLRRYWDRLKFMYLLYHDKLGINKLKYIQPVTLRPTRSNHAKKLTNFSCRTDVFKNSFFPRTVREWNALRPDVVEYLTVDAFMSSLKKQASP